ncbi:ABC transporter permease [Roseisolibacter agri]|uniref:Macrolide export ATP-binding/permease protein MacB n=1 Tax=Roseisolibacter agri TaxID=2014610 RepID=A0AA37QEX3_9BACT|nr:ABC transporter permease [Roseisolibacter agri]GLC25095.1 hypothetical protein rosag_16080 [Roseisolibacter agri]
MPWHRRLLRRFRTADFERERAFHLAERADELRASGLSAHGAAVEARRRFGNPLPPGGVAVFLGSAAADLRYALRALRQAPLVALIAVGSIALGIGATTAVYTLVDALALRALPVPHPEELYLLGPATPGAGGLREELPGDGPLDGVFTNPLWEALRDAPNGFDAVAAFSALRVNVARAGEPRYVDAALAGGDYFRVFGVTPAAGRLFTRQDDVRGCPAIAVLSHAFWDREYARDPAVVGHTLSVNGRPFQIVGVSHEGFSGPEVGRAPPITLPLCAEAALPGERSLLDSRHSWWLTVIGRRPGGADPRQVAARLRAAATAAYAATTPPDWTPSQQRDYATRELAMAPAPQGISPLRAQYSRALLTLLGFVAVVMLAACMNVANLLLARATGRRRELAVRLAIGAGRPRLVRQLLVESALLAALGAAGGLLLARLGAAALLAVIATAGSPIELDLSLHPRVLAFTTAVAALNVALFGVLPALRATRVAPQAAMQVGGRAVARGHGRFSGGQALVAAQVALSLVLLVGAGALVQSFAALVRVDTGFRADGVLLVTTDLSRSGLRGAGLVAARGALLEAMRAIPGVTHASQSELTPVGGASWSEAVEVEGYTPRTRDDAQVWFNRVDRGYFATMGMRLRSGREFDARDAATAPGAAIVNEAFARKYFRTPNVVGRRIRRNEGGTRSAPLTIVGVAPNAVYLSLREPPRPTVYVAMSQGAPAATMRAELRTAADPASVGPAVRAAVARVAPGAAVAMRTLSDQVRSSIRRERVLAAFASAFGAVVVALSMLGLYGVTAYAVARRTTEIGVRQALGAGRGRVVGMVLADVARVLVAGALVGIPVALGAGRLLEAQLFRTRPSDPLVLAAAAALLGLAALLAGLVPAMRAARVPPLVALRDE